MLFPRLFCLTLTLHLCIAVSQKDKRKTNKYMLRSKTHKNIMYVQFSQDVSNTQLRILYCFKCPCYGTHTASFHVQNTLRMYKKRHIFTLTIIHPHYQHFPPRVTEPPPSLSPCLFARSVQGLAKAIITSVCSFVKMNHGNATQQRCPCIF